MPSALPYLALEEREGGKVSKGGKGTATVLLHKAGQVCGEDYITPLVLRELWRIIVLRFFRPTFNWKRVTLKLTFLHPLLAIMSFQTILTSLRAHI